jgi:hypothetical protein
MSKGSMDDFHREAAEQAKAMGEQFRKQFDNMGLDELLWQLSYIKVNRRQEFIRRLESSVTVDGEPLWSFCMTSAALVLMTELERRRKEMQ